MSALFPPDERSSRPTSNQHAADITSNVTEQFKCMLYVSGGNKEQTVEDLAKSFMTTLGMSDTNPEYDTNLKNLTSQLSGIVIHSGPSEKVHENQPSSSAPTAAPPSQSTTQIPPSSKSPIRNEYHRDQMPSRRHASRSRSPIARFTKAASKSLRSLSPRRRNNDKATRSPLAKQGHFSHNNISTDADDDEFYDARSTNDSFMANSPAPKQPQKPSGGGDGRPPAPSTSSRPPLTTVNTTNSPSAFKFDREKDKFQVGSSPPKKSKFGSPGKIGRSPINRSPPQTAQTNRGSDMSFLSPLTVTEASPSIQSVKKQTSTGGAPASFASPVPIFHAPETFIGMSGSRRIPTPQNIMQNEPQMDEKLRRQTAPPNMGAAATAAAESFKSVPQTPFDANVTGISNTVPDTSDTAETMIKKKTRNTATPNLSAPSSGPQFNVDLSHNANMPKMKGKRGNTLRKGFKASGPAKFNFSMDEIKETGTNNNASDASQTPSNGSTVSMDTSPILSPLPTANQTNIGGFNTSARFNVGVGDTQPQHAKARGKRKDNKRRSQNARSQSTNNVYGPSRSAFDLNHHQNMNQNQNISIPNPQPENQWEKIYKEISALRDLGKNCYIGAKYQQSIHVYSEGIQRFKFELFNHIECKDLLAVLLSNRAAALLMIGAYQSAVEDCRSGILFVTDPRTTNIANCPDANPNLLPKLYNRMGRLHTKLGNVDDADKAFEGAIQSATAMQPFVPSKELEKIKMDADLGRADVSKLRKILVQIQALDGQHCVHPRNNRDNATQRLQLIKVALQTANGCDKLHLAKIECLKELERWREILNHCERFGAANAMYDGCFIGDLFSKNPFPGVPVAKYLRSNYFANTSVDDIKGAELMLDRKSATEAILRLPQTMMPYYLRSLRLNEKYVIAEACMRSLENHIADNYPDTSQFIWLTAEVEKLRRTRTEREKADTMYMNKMYSEAAQKYAEVLNIDAGVLPNATHCRLHAILHCNRAACFMAERKFRDGMNECTAALRIYPHYLKALLRRARCHKRLDQIQEAVRDFNQWLKIVKLGREGRSSPVVGDCIFDGPHTVKEDEIQGVQAELNDIFEEKARAEEKARVEAEERARRARNSSQGQSWSYQSDHNFYTGSKSPSHEEAHRRRENFYSSQNGSRRWDSFKDRTQSSRQEKPKSQKPRRESYGYKSKSSPGGFKKNQNKSQGSPRDNTDHYSALGIDRRATEEEIKKAYKKMALKYHPDKNKDNPTAADNFLRIKDAYETLKDPSARRKYDSKSRRRY